MSKGKNIAYVRVSTVEQNEARQREALGKYNIDKWFIEKASGKTMKRPKLQEMLGFIREDDVVYVEESYLLFFFCEALCSCSILRCNIFMLSISDCAASVRRSSKVHSSVPAASRKSAACSSEWDGS